MTAVSLAEVTVTGLVVATLVENLVAFVPCADESAIRKFDRAPQFVSPVLGIEYAVPPIGGHRIEVAIAVPSERGKAFPERYTTGKQLKERLLNRTKISRKKPNSHQESLYGLTQPHH